MYRRRKLIGVTIDVDVQKWQDVVLLFFVSEIDVAMQIFLMLLQTKESIFISHQKPQLNNNQTSVPLHLFRP